MSVEALWIATFGDASAPATMQHGGVVVLETQRLFGGDSAYAYAGTYSVVGDIIAGSVTIARHNPDPNFVDIWLTGEDELQFEFHGQLNGDKIVALLSRQDAPQIGLYLRRFRDLP
jgi:hypothetical protein